MIRSLLLRVVVISQGTVASKEIPAGQRKMAATPFCLFQIVQSTMQYFATCGRVHVHVGCDNAMPT